MNKTTDDEILNYLMTSEFEEGLTPDEYKFLLQKFRNFYRVVSCSISNYQNRTEEALVRREEMQKLLEERTTEFNIEKANLINKINNILSRKLTIKERLFGKIIEGNENK